jgi:hypothetical protein
MHVLGLSDFGLLPDCGILSVLVALFLQVNHRSRKKGIPKLLLLMPGLSEGTTSIMDSILS